MKKYQFSTAKEDLKEKCIEKPLHWVVVMAKVDRVNATLNTGKDV